jgi:hypothetical protein
MVFNTLDGPPLVAEIRDVLDLESNGVHVHICLPTVGSTPDRRPESNSGAFSLGPMILEGLFVLCFPFRVVSPSWILGSNGTENRFEEARGF